MSSCCHHNHDHDTHEHDQNTSSSFLQIDWLLYGSAVLLIIGYSLFLFQPSFFQTIPQAEIFSKTSFDLLNEVWIGILVGIILVGLVGHLPREMVTSLLGKPNTFAGIFRAAFAGVLLDLCNHGIVMVGMKLYERGASIGQTIAFLTSSPWNSFSLMVILWALVGFWWMFAFLIGSVIVAILSGIIFDRLVARGTLPDNPHKIDLAEDYSVKSHAKEIWANRHITPKTIGQTFWNGLKDSKMILRWIFFGLVLSALVRSFVDASTFQTYFGPTLLGLGMTLIIATILEICSEGSLPIAADILKVAHAPGNAFTFLMAGIATDYTEFMALKETTKSWKISIFVPLIMVPQVVLMGLCFNYAAQHPSFFDPISQYFNEIATWVR